MGDLQREDELRRIADLAAQSAAETVVRVAAAAADQVTLNAVHAAQALSEATKIDLGYIKAELADIKVRLDSKFVTIECFEPIKSIVYGQVALILIAVVGGVLAMIIRKG